MKTRRSVIDPAAAIQDDDAALKVLMQLLPIPGRSGHEGAVMKFIADRLRKAGASAKSLSHDTAHRRSSLKGEIGNLVLKLPGRAGEPRRMLSAHVDTVPICVDCQPVRRARRIVTLGRKTGLGADDRAGAAVVLLTAEALLRQRLPHPPLTFLWTVQEEVGLHGARYVQLSKLGRPELAFNFDGSTPTRLTIGATGGYRMRITVHGRASHAGNAPAEGVSAIAIASLAIGDLVENGWHGEIIKGRRRGTSNVGVFHGGEATNVVTDRVVIRAEARSHEAPFRRRIVAEIRRAFERAAKRVRSADGETGTVEFEGQLDYEAFRLPLDNPSVVAATQALHALEIDPDYAISNGGLDANWLTAHGIPAVTLGCGQRAIHTVEEELDIPDFQLARRIAMQLATGIV
ncbi:MAG: M20/M25/M40 family metallo-hydrolase [Pirellulales bacterium]